ncbi:MAG: tRNA uracil 4-sulfurtransferase ThiI [Candidatus Thorarchaeota archaeon]
MDPQYSVVLLRFGEIGIKSNQTRRRFTRILSNHVRTALKEKQVPFDQVRQIWGRIFIDTTHVEEAAIVVSRVFGVVSASPVVETSAVLETILTTGLELARAEFKKGLTFAVDSRRIGTHPYSSQDIREKLGSAIFEGLSELDLRVNLSDPQQEIYVEVRDEIAYIFAKTIKGVGGMPTGSQGKVVCTLSTGLDSPMAAYKIMKRGCIPTFVYFDNIPHSDEACIDVVIKQAQTLADYIYNHEVRLYIVPHGPDLDEALEHGPVKSTCIFCKRNMMRLAREVAIREDAHAIVTGEIIGEQASQTTANLKVINGAVQDFPILRPLAGDDKDDITALARMVGTYKYATGAPKCCTLAPKYPAVQADIDTIEAAEEKMNFDILKQEVDASRIIILREGAR